MILDYSVKMKGTMELKSNSHFEQEQLASMLSSLAEN